MILYSDGVANVGATGPEQILRRIKPAVERRITLTSNGVGMGNYNDVLMEQLADQGDGSYYYVVGYPRGVGSPRPPFAAYRRNAQLRVTCGR